MEPNLPVKKVYASRGKYLRAEPIPALRQGRVAHVGEFPELERQMCDFAADGLSNGKSPDRLDALVWALTELMLTSTRQPLIRPLYAADKSVATLSADLYLLDGAGNPARVVRKGNLAWPIPSRAANGIEIAFVGGYGSAAANVPAPIRQSILLLIAHWYEHREPVEIGAAGVPVPPMVCDLLQPYRPVRL